VERSSSSRTVRTVAWVLGSIGLVAILGVSCSLVGRGKKTTEVPTEAVGRRDIAQTVEATGTVEPVEIVEIRSKASGQILRMPVEVGSVVKAGYLLAQVDTVNVQNQYRQAVASLRASQASVEVSGAQKKRADELFSRGVITTDQHETATLAYANAQSDLVRARTNLDIARQALEDATVRAPSDGTILSQPVTKGQVIASATQSASGGTVLLTMADLSRIQMRALVGETDIGNVHPGQPASVTVDAYPNRTFRSTVVKIEPEAVVQQSVTMFPVLVSIQNEGGLLLPGMNGEVTVYIAQASDVLAVPLDAVRSARELTAVASALGVDADSVQAQVQRQIAARFAARAGGDSAAHGRLGGAQVAANAAGGDAAGRAGGAGAWRGRQGTGGASGAMGGGQGGAWRQRQGATGDPTRPGGASAQGGAGGAVGAGGGAAGGGANGVNGAGRTMGARNAQVVFVKTANGLEPRVVRLGVSDFDYAQVLDGLKEGDQVALLSVAEVQAKRSEDQNRLRQRIGGGMPGMTSTGGARSSGGARPSGGGR